MVEKKEKKRDGKKRIRNGRRATVERGPRDDGVACESGVATPGVGVRLSCLSRGAKGREQWRLLVRANRGTRCRLLQSDAQRRSCLYRHSATCRCIVLRCYFKVRGVINSLEPPLLVRLTVAYMIVGRGE